MKARILSALVIILSWPYTAQAAESKIAVFAAGCFWCIEKDYEKHDGVIEAVSGYMGGHTDNPTYKQVSSGGTGHLEVVRVEYDPEILTYKDLLEIFWANVDPFDARGQFCDKGGSYKSAIFYGNAKERELARKSKTYIAEKSGKDVATSIRESTTFYPAEDYHQNYYKINPNKYGFYRWRCGRDSRLEDIWGSAAAKRVKIFNGK